MIRSILVGDRLRHRNKDSLKSKVVSLKSKVKGLNTYDFGLTTLDYFHKIPRSANETNSSPTIM